MLVSPGLGCWYPQARGIPTPKSGGYPFWGHFGVHFGVIFGVLFGVLLWVLLGSISGSCLGSFLGSFYGSFWGPFLGTQGCPRIKDNTASDDITKRCAADDMNDARDEVTALEHAMVNTHKKVDHQIGQSFLLKTGYDQ